ncbi:MAG: hypothetical protein LBP52_03295 [Burkholderiaceae bacterium]|jgi:hypothetical protein|nr:hypothetical protein [Burkholderiaceae bacterium]
MTNDIVVGQMARRDGGELMTPEELRNLSTQDLRGKLAQSLTFTAKHLVGLAMIWAELERRGEYLDDLKIGLAVYLPQIAAGKLDADAVIRFAGQPTILKSIAGLPINEQREIANGKPLEVLTITPSGVFEPVALPAYSLTAAQARQVFTGERIRSAEQQKALLVSATTKHSLRTLPGNGKRVRYDPQRDLIFIGRSSASIGEVVAALTEGADLMAGAAIKGETKNFPIKITEAQHRMLKVRAAEAGLSTHEFLEKLICRFAAVPSKDTQDAGA